MRVWPTIAVVCGLVSGAGAVPALTDAQVTQLATAQDLSREWDEAALYPLLTNVVEWSEADEAGAIVPDYSRLHTAPEAQRGRLFLIEGQLGAAPTVLERRLSRPGPWDHNLQQWHVLVQRDPDEVVVLLLLDPMPPEQLPRRGGSRVRAAARFYKVWRHLDRDDQPTNYLMFVGRWVHVGDRGATPGGGGGGWTLGVVVLVLVAAWYAFWRLGRLALKPKALSTRSLKITHDDVEDAAEQPKHEQPLPSDPAEALRELQRCHDEDTPAPGV